MTSPTDRALAIRALCRDVLMTMEMSARGTIADRLALVEVVVEIVNKFLYSYTISQEMLDEVDDLLNRPYQEVAPTPESIVPLFITAMATLRRFDHHVARWT